MRAKKDYRGLEDSDSEHGGSHSHSHGPGGHGAGLNPAVCGSRVRAMNLTVGLLYFCNQRPGIFVAPYLLLQDIPESKIGFVLFVSGMVALTLQTPAGQLVDELHNKTRVLVVGNMATILGCLLLSNSANIGLVTLAVTINVVSDVFVFPTLYATTLGIFGSDGIEQQAPLNETCTHSGNATFAILAGVIVVFGTTNANSIFYICVAMRMIGVFLVLRFINSYNIDFNKSRGLVDVVASTSSSHSPLEGGLVSSAPGKKDDWASIPLASAPGPASPPMITVEEPLQYRALLTDRHVLVFLSSVMLFHFANAAMLPLLSQQLFINNSEKGFAFAAAAVITAQLSMVASASLAGSFVPRLGTKPLFLLALMAIPVRGVLIVLLLRAEGGEGTNALLLATQLLDGLAGGIFGVLLVLVTENLARGSGRFALLLGLAKTAEGIGASFSNLVGEVLAEYYGYAAAFLFLSAASLLPLVLYSLGMPAAVSVSVTVSAACDGGEEGVDGGEWGSKNSSSCQRRRVQDNLSVASHHGASHHGASHRSDGGSTHSSSGGSVEMRMNRSFE